MFLVDCGFCNVCKQPNQGISNGSLPRPVHAYRDPPAPVPPSLGTGCSAMDELEEKLLPGLLPGPQAPHAAPFKKDTPNDGLAETPTISPAECSSCPTSPAALVEGPPLPYRRSKPRKTTYMELPAEIADLDRSENSHGSEAARMLKRASTRALELHLEQIHAKEASSSLKQKFQKRASARNSQSTFFEAWQTVIVFDWDDTLFPTTNVYEDMGVRLSLPLEQHTHIDAATLADFQAKIQRCEARCRELLAKALTLAHVVVVTLASPGWVDMACDHLYPTVGKMLQEEGIPIIYAQELVGSSKKYDKSNFSSDEEVERYWGTIKGEAIQRAVDKFYSRYEGQSWKNVVSIGDSSFERYGLMAATSAYMQGSSGISADTAVWQPTQAGCWEQDRDGHLLRLRAKCCKLVDQPDVDELTIQMEMVDKWLLDIVNLDAGFDLDLEILEDETQVAVIEAVLRGERPSSELPRPKSLPPDGI